MLVGDLKRVIREVPDYPTPGVRFFDVSTLFRNGDAFHTAVQKMVQRFEGQRLDALAAIEARGFVLASAIAYGLGLGLILVRKAGKLPAAKLAEDYRLEYGNAAVEMHCDAVEPGQRILVVDDVLATGGTAAATGRLVERLGGKVEGYAFLVELGFLDGRAALGGNSVFSLLHYDGA